MAGSTTQRLCQAESVILTTSSATTPEIDIGRFASGTVFIPNGSSITTLTYYSSYIAGGAVAAAYDSAGTAITQTVQADRCYPIPAGVFGSGIIRITGNAVGVIKLSLKS